MSEVTLEYTQRESDDVLHVDQNPSTVPDIEELVVIGDAPYVVVTRGWFISKLADKTIVRVVLEPLDIDPSDAALSRRVGS